MDTQDHMNPTKDEIKLLIDNALLQNNERINGTIQASAEKITVAVNQKTDTYIGQISNIAHAQGALETKVSTLAGKVNNLWAKMISVGAACATLGALVVLLWQK